MLRTHMKRLAKRLQHSYDVYNRIEVSKAALLYNIDFFHKKTKLQIIPVLKGNAYGHGIEQVATALRSRRLPYIAVDGYFEALKIRSVSRQPVLIMGMIKTQNIPKLNFDKFTFVVHDEHSMEAFSRLRREVKIHLEINTGMNRYGLSIKDLEKYIRYIKTHSNLKLEGVMSHLADSDGNDEETISSAVDKFDECIDKILASGLKPTIFHVGQSAGSLRARSRYANTMRLGIGLYGINPFPSGHKLYRDCQKLKPAMSLISTVSKVIDLKKGDKVSYNYTFTAPKAMRIGVLPLGYHEGVDRSLSNKGLVKIGGKFQHIVGRVCMNHTVVRLDNAAKLNDEAVVYSGHQGDRNSVDAIAKQHGLFADNLLTDLSPDVRRYLVD